ncbi:MAG: hypothetical protein Crog4KO_29390 [Crocinitomicaceae bacterium]
MKVDQQKTPPVQQHLKGHQQSQVSQQATSFAEAGKMRKEALSGLSHADDSSFSVGAPPQQNPTFSKPISPEHIRYYEMVIHREAELLFYSGNIAFKGKVQGNGGIGNYFMKKGAAVELVSRHSSFDNKLYVRSKEVHYRDAYGNIQTAQGNGWQYFYIDVSNTNLNAPTSKIDNQQSAALDLIAFKESVLARQLLNFNTYMLEYSKRYKKAWDNFQGALKKDAQASQKKAQQLWILVSMITAGSLGWVGEVLGTTAKFSKFLLPGLEDAVQAGFAGEIALASTPKPITDASVSVHPDKLHVQIQDRLSVFKQETDVYVGDIIQKVQKTPAKTDRVELMLSIFKWYSANVVANTINEKPDWGRFQLMTEKNLWASWLIAKENPSFTEYYKFGSGSGTIDYNYGWSHIGENAQKRLNDVGYNWGWEGDIKQAEFFGTDRNKAHSLPRNGKPYYKTITYEGSESTMRAVKWAKFLQHRYKNNPFEFK